MQDVKNPFGWQYIVFNEVPLQYPFNLNSSPIKDLALSFSTFLASLYIFKYSSLLIVFIKLFPSIVGTYLVNWTDDNFGTLFKKI